MSEKQKKIFVIIKSRRPFPRKVEIEGVVSEKKEFSHVITKNRPFPRTVHSIGVMSEKQFCNIHWIFYI